MYFTEASSSVPDIAALETCNKSSLFRRRRPLFWLALAFCCGIAADDAIAPALPKVGALFLTALFAVGAFLFLYPRQKLSASAQLFFYGLTLALAGGMLTHALKARIPASDDVSRQTSALPSFIELRGTIVEVSRARANTPESWTLSVEALGADVQALAYASGLVRISLPKTEMAHGLAEGDRVSLRARLESPPEVTVPGTFDYSAYLANSGIRRTGAVFPKSVRLLSSPAWWRADYFLRRCSTMLSERVESILGGDGSQAALLNAILFGRRERLDISDRESFAISGAAHLLAISGLQIQFLAWLLWKASALLGITRRRSAIFILLISLAYCALGGADSPIMRATVMIALYLAATIFYREPDPLNILGASALLILFIAPAELFNAGFQLSFLAVFALITIYPALEDSLNRSRRRQPTLIPESGSRQSVFESYCASARRSFFISLAASIGTAPIVAWHMGRFSALSLAVNLVAVPLGSLCMVAGLAMLALSLVSSTLASFAAAISLLLLIVLQKLNAIVASLPFASVDLPPPALPVLALYAAVLLWIWIDRPRLTSFTRVCALLVLCVALLNASLLFREDASVPSVTVLDLKSGRAALVESPSGGAALIDAGGFGSGTRIVEMLRRRGISRLALLVVTADEPEAISGALDLLKHVPAGRVILPRDSSPSNTRRELERFLTSRDIAYAFPDTTQILQGPGAVRWEFLDDGNPPNLPVGAQTAIAVRVSLPGTRVLFVDARSEAALQRLLDKPGAGAWTADVLRVSAGAGGRWPSNVSRLVRESGCRAIIAGSGGPPEESPGLDLAALAEASGVKLLSPHREGSLRVQADAGSGSRSIQAFRAGEWKDAP